jgi:hypothetical protein
MSRNLSILILATALAGPATAEDIRVSLVGKDEGTVQADVHKAAVKICRDIFIGDLQNGFYEMDGCVASVQDDAMAQVRAIRQAAAARSDVRVLSALSTNKPQPGR